MTRRPNQLREFILILLSAICSGCASPQHHPQVTFNGPSQAILYFGDEKAAANGLPCIEASINGVKGVFIIDTGSNVPYLTKTAVQRCHLITSTAVIQKTDMYYAPKAGLRVVKNVTVNIADSPLTINWPVVYVGDREDNWFGLIDYHTLRAMHAVMDLNDKTIGISQ